MENAAELLAVIGALHEGVVDPHAWDRGLLRLSQLTRAAGILIGGADDDVSRVSVSGHGIGQATASVMAGRLGTAAANPYLAALRRLPLRGVVGHGDIGGQDVMEASEVWRHVMAPSGLIFTRAAVLDRAPEWSDFAVIARTSASGDFLDTEVSSFSVIVPHLGRAIRARRELAHYRRLANDAMAGLNALQRGVVLVDASGRVNFANTVAHEVLEDRDGLILREDALVAQSHPDDRRLKQLLRSAAKTGRGKAATAVDAMTVTRRSGRPPLALMAEPLAPSHGEELGAPRGSEAIVFVSDPERSAGPRPEHAASVYGFTPGETKVAMEALQGGSVYDIAQRLDLSKNTVKTHLVSVYAKVGVRKRAELSARIAGDLGF